MALFMNVVKMAKRPSIETANDCELFTAHNVMFRGL